MLKFGDTFKYNGNDYVYLVKTDEILYAAEILDIQNTKLVNEMYEKQCRAGRKPEILSKSPLYCLVMLSTELFRERAAHFYNTGKNDPANNECSLADLDLVGHLNEIDLKEIKKEIMDGPVPLELRELTKDTVV